MEKEIIRPATRPAQKWLPFTVSEEILIEETPRGKKEERKLDLFEKGLGRELKSSDSIDSTLEKIVRMALAAEFGASFVKTAGSQKMVKTIARGIKEDQTLRKSALMIVDRFAKQ